MRFSLAADEASEGQGYWPTSGGRSATGKDRGVGDDDADVDGDKVEEAEADGDDETSTSVTEECLTKSNIDT